VRGRRKEGRRKAAVIKENDGPCTASRIVRNNEIIAYRTPDNSPSIIITALADLPQPIRVRWISACSWHFFLRRC